MSNNPFVGLRPYRSSESDFFFGRKKEVEDVLSILQKNKLVLLTGPAGSGKSSIINAGLIPRLKKVSVVNLEMNGQFVNLDQDFLQSTTYLSRYLRVS